MCFHPFFPLAGVTSGGYRLQFCIQFRVLRTLAEKELGDWLRAGDCLEDDVHGQCYRANLRTVNDERRQRVRSVVAAPCGGMWLFAWRLDSIMN